MTFSIMATDPVKNQIGYAVASKTFYVGVIGFSEPGLGAVLCQGETNFDNGPKILGLIRRGKTLQQIVEQLRREDPRIEEQQLGIVDWTGNVIAYTGKNCDEWAGHLTFEGYVCLGNILTGREVLNSMSKTYKSSKGLMAERLVNALLAADAVGGDRRGKQSASIKLVSPRSGFNGSDTLLDLNIYDHVEPVIELARITKIALEYLKVLNA